MNIRPGSKGLQALGPSRRDVRYASFRPQAAIPVPEIPLKYDIVALGFMIAGLASQDIAQAQTGQAPATRGVMANETYVEVEAAAARGAVALWALGAIEGICAIH